MNFEEAENKFKQLKSQFEAGTITETDFKKQLEELMVEDRQGNWWMIGYKSELWYRYDGANWVQTDPPLGTLTRSASTRTTDWNSSINPQSSGFPRSVLVWVVIGIVGCSLILLSAWGISSVLTFLNDESQTPTATESATPTHTILPPSPTEAITPTPTLSSSSGKFSKTGFSFTFGRNGINNNCAVIDPGTVFSEADFEEDKWLYFSTEIGDDDKGNSIFWTVLEPDGSTFFGPNERVLEDLEDSCFWQGFSMTSSPTTGVYELILEYKAEIIYRLTFNVE